jgi:hypothetical protein
MVAGLQVLEPKPGLAATDTPDAIFRRLGGEPYLRSLHHEDPLMAVGAC